MKFGDEPHDIEPEPEVRAAVGVEARLPQRLEDPARASPAAAADRDSPLRCARRSGSAARRTRDRRAGLAEIDRVVDELVEHLHDQVRQTPSMLERLIRRLEREIPLREGACAYAETAEAITGTRSKSAPLGAVDRLFDARGGSPSRPGWHSAARCLRGRDRGTRARSAVGGLSVSRFSSEERTIVSGVRISCASLPASVRR